jgi:hypothetical protein
MPAGPQTIDSGIRDLSSTADTAPGLSWSWDLDYEALLAALDGPAPWLRTPPAVAEPPAAAGPAPSAEPAAARGPATSAEPAAARGPASSAKCATPSERAEPNPALLFAEDDQEAHAAMPVGEGTLVPTGVIAGRIAETLPPGPALAGWLATAEVSELEDGALAGVAASYRRLAAWAQAGELSAVAQLASRAALRDEKISVDDDGRPASISASACAEVSLGLVMSQYGAAWWTDLGVTLQWRLTATGAALRDGLIDLQRARLIAEATSLLDDETAQSVEQVVLPRAGEQTTAQLRTALRRSVIAADPEGAERRREEAERRAKVSLYGDQDNTATLLGSGLPTVQAAAAMSRITALARAMKSSGMPGGIDLLRAQVYIGLLLGTVPFIPPPEGAPPGPAGPDPAGPAGPGSASPGRAGPAGPGSASPGRAGPAGPGSASPGRAGPAGPGSAGPGPAGPGPAGGRDDSGRRVPGQNDGSRNGRDPNDAGSAACGPAVLHLADSGRDGWDDVPCPGDEDAPPDEGGPFDDWNSWQDEAEDDNRIGAVPAWPALPAMIPASPARLGPADETAAGRPPAGLLDVILPWNVLAGSSLDPGRLGRIGSITAPQARRVAQIAAHDPAAQWRIIVTSAAGQALGVARIPWRVPAGGKRDSTDDFVGGGGLVGRVTLTISEDDLVNRLAHSPPRLSGPAASSSSDLASSSSNLAAPSSSGPSAHDPPDALLAAALRAACRAVARAGGPAASDATAGGCAHAGQAGTYRPPPRLQEFVVARDLTCRFPSCGQPAWRGDLDHTVPWPQGPTCRCNLGALCRTHHLVKHEAGWALSQAHGNGTFTWVTPSGRRYTVTPDVQPV